MLHTKLLLRHLACASWLLAAGLVLGWSGKAVAQDVNISLTANPTAISEDAGATDVVVTATLDEKVLDDDVVVLLVTDNESTAIRDVDYTATLSPLTITAGSASGATTITITPWNDKRAGGDKTIRLKGLYANNAVGTVDITLKDAGASSVLSFAEDAVIYHRTYIVGREVTDYLLPEASGGTGNLTYSVSSLPAGLSFNASTRTLSGTPTAATDGAVVVLYTVIDESGATVALAFSITIVIVVDDATISLAANPTAISEDAGATDVVVTATLDGKVFDDDVVVFLRIDEDIDGNVARRDVDYTATLSPLTIAAGSASGATTITITPRNDKRVGANKTIRLTAAYANTVVPVDITLKDAGGGSSFSFSSNAVIDDQTYAAGTEITPLVLPEASGGTGDLTYSVSALPAGLSFDAATRTISGTPTEVTDGAVTIVYAVIDEEENTAALTFTITIVTDGDAKILLTVDPTAISEDAGATDVVVTGTLDGLDGKVFDDDVVMLLTFDEDINGDGEVNGDDKAAVLNVDYVAELRLLAIPPGSVSGTTTITITPINDKKVEGDETIRLRLRGSHANNRVTARDAEGDDVKMTVVPVDITLQDTGEGGASFFAADAAIDDYTYTAGTAIVDVVLPEASGGAGELTYSVSALPTGLSFDAATRTISGTPTAETNGITIVYTATDEDGTTDTLTFTITVHLAFEENFDQFDLFGEGAGAEEPEVPEASEEPSLAFADDAVINDQVYTAEWPIADVVLPEASGGTGDLTYSVSALPAGLSFDAATRTLSGTPTEVTDGAVTIVYTVIDEEENAAALTFTITVNEGLTFEDFFDLFGAGKAVPTTSRD